MQRGERASVGLLAIARLLAKVVHDRLKRGADADAGLVICRWARDAMAKSGGSLLDIAPMHRTLVGDHGHSAQVLAAAPAQDTYACGPSKAHAMQFLAPHGLTIIDGDAWRRLRSFNELVLASGEPHPESQTWLTHIRAAFHAPVLDQDDISRAMGRAMHGIVFGDAPIEGSDPGDDARVLFSVVASPTKRVTVGRFYAARRERFYAFLTERWERGSANGEATLVARARRHAGDIDPASLIQQIPNWMFTFTGSGTKLLARALAIIVSRPDILERVLREIASAGPLSDASSIYALPYLDACIREAGRLFPAVATTYHQAAPSTGERSDFELVHWFSLMHRDDALGVSTHEFRPERWLTDPPDAPRAAANVFLRGPRRCPGEQLILFVCRAAAARLLSEFKLSGGHVRLARDPLPVSFPKNAARFTVRA